MYDPELLLEKLRTLLEALERIPRRFADIAAPERIFTAAMQELIVWTRFA